MLADLPTLVKRWRQQLGLIQAQFAREVGAALRRVTPGTMLAAVYAAAGEELAAAQWPKNFARRRRGSPLLPRR
jgi:hypothetical protein